MLGVFLLGCFCVLLGCFCGFLQHLCRYILPEALNRVGSIETSLLYRCRPYGETEGFGSHAYYIDTVPTGLKRFLKYPRFSRRIRFGWNADRKCKAKTNLVSACGQNLGVYTAKPNPAYPNRDLSFLFSGKLCLASTASEDFRGVSGAVRNHTYRFWGRRVRRSRRLFSLKLTRVVKFPNTLLAMKIAN